MRIGILSSGGGLGLPIREGGQGDCAPGQLGAGGGGPVMGLLGAGEGGVLVLGMCGVKGGWHVLWQLYVEEGECVKYRNNKYFM